MNISLVDVVLLFVVLKNKHMKKILIFAAMCCLLLSCTKQENPIDERIPINISVDQLTKVNDQSYEDCDKIGVFVVNYDFCALVVV